MVPTTTGPMSGNGDSVMLFVGDARKAKITNSGELNFAVHVVSLDSGTLDLAS